MIRFYIFFVIFISIASCKKELTPEFNALNEAKVSSPTVKDQDAIISFSRPNETVTISGSCDARIKKLEISLETNSNWKSIDEITSEYTNNCAQNQTYEFKLSPINNFFNFVNNIPNQRFSIYIRGDLGTIKSEEFKFIIDSGYAYLIAPPEITSSNPITISAKEDILTITGKCNPRLSLLQYSQDNISFENFSNGSNGTINNCEADGTFTLVFNPVQDFIRFDRNSNSQTHTLIIRGKDDVLLSAPAELTINSGDILGPTTPKLTTYSHPDNPVLYIDGKTDVNTDIVNYQCSVDNTNWFNCSNGDVITNNGNPYKYYDEGTLYLKSIDDVGNESEIAIARFQKDHIERGFSNSTLFINKVNSDLSILNYTSNSTTSINTKPFPKIYSLNSDGTINKDFKPFYYNISLTGILNDPNSNDTIVSFTSELNDNSRTYKNIFKIDEFGQLKSYSTLSTTGLGTNNLYSGKDNNNNLYFKVSYNNLKRILNSSSLWDENFNITETSTTSFQIGSTGIFSHYNNMLKKYDLDTGEIINSFTENIGTMQNENTMLYRYFTSNDEIILIGNFTSFNGYESTKIITLDSSGNILTGFNSGTGLGYNSSYMIATYLPKFNSLNDELFWNYSSSSYNYNGFSSNAGANKLNVISPNGSLSIVETLSNVYSQHNWVIDTEKTNLFLESENRIIKLGPDYSPDLTFNENATHHLAKLTRVSTMDDGKLVIYKNGVNFLTTDYSTSTSAAITLDHNSKTLNPSIFNKQTNLKQLNTGKYLAYGNFTQIAGYPATYLARLNSDFSYDTTFFIPAPPSIPEDIEIDSDNNIYFCDVNMSTYQDSSTGKIAKLDSNANPITRQGGFNDHGENEGLSTLSFFNYYGIKKYCTLSYDEKWLYFTPRTNAIYRGKDLFNNVYRLNTDTGDLDPNFSMSTTNNFSIFHHNDSDYIISYQSLYKVNPNSTKTLLTSGLGNYVKYIGVKDNILYTFYNDTLIKTNLSTYSNQSYNLGCNINSAIIDEQNSVITATVETSIMSCQNKIINGIVNFNLDGTIVEDNFTGYTSSE